MNESSETLPYATPPPRPEKQMPALGFVACHVLSVWILVAGMGIWMDRAFEYFSSHDSQGVWGSPHADHYAWVGFELPLTIVLASAIVLAIAMLVHVARGGTHYLGELVFLSLNGGVGLFAILLIASDYAIKFYP